ncbi:MAG: 16S rRNA (cytidine(1402)-2'-O)-methyltransferase [Actinomycetota bacterium]|nr:16S rRNA (cytidine(1402)-2'-O)-methyltransferase [Actinomycetota bacterium]
MPGRLILCGTPIGNLGDLSQRGIQTLREADLIACEDTRRTRKLLSHFGITPKDLFVYNDINERRQGDKLIARIEGGTEVALVSDAGMPGLSDPGFRLVSACVERGLLVEVVPGPSAVVAALAVSGLPPGRFVFEGFLPRKTGDRRRRLEELATEVRTVVFFESPHRLEASIGDLLKVLGDRPVAIARELTKLHEEVRRGSLSEILEGLKRDPARGEVVIVLGGAELARSDPSSADLAHQARELMASGVERKAALASVAKEAGVSKKRVFDALVTERDP